MLVKHVLALVVLCLMVVGLASPGLSESRRSDDSPGLANETRDAEWPRTLDELEAHIRWLGEYAKRAEYDDGLLKLYDAYLNAQQHAKAAATARKLWQLRKKELGESDPLTIGAMQDLANTLLRDDARRAEAERILDDALHQLRSLANRAAASQVCVLKQVPKASTAELEILESTTCIIERNVQAFNHDSLRAHRLRLGRIMDRLPAADTHMRDQVKALGRRAWFAHEAFAIRRWEAYGQTKALAGEEPYPAQALVQLYSEGVGISSPAAAGAGSRMPEDFVDPKVRAVKTLDVLTRVVATEMAWAHGKTHLDHLLEPLSAIVKAAPHAAGAPGTREKLANVSKLLLEIMVGQYGRHSESHLKALEQVMSAYDSVAPGAAANLLAERNTVKRRLEARQLLELAFDAFLQGRRSSSVRNDVKAKLRNAIDRGIQAWGNESPELLTVLMRDNVDPDALLEVMDLLFARSEPTSGVALEFAAHVLDVLITEGREHEAFQRGRASAQIAEKALGLQSPITQKLITLLLSPALRYGSDTERRDLLAKSELLEVPAGPRLIQELLGHGDAETALRVAWKNIKGETSPSLQDSMRWLRPDYYDLISILGKQSDLAAYVKLVEADIASIFGGMLQAGPSASPEAAQVLQHIRSVAAGLLDALRGKCDAGAKARDRLASANRRQLKQGKPDLTLVVPLLGEMQIERVVMDCFVRARRLTEAVRLIKTSTLMSDIGLPAESESGLRPALVLASASDWAGAVDQLKRLFAARQLADEKLAQEDFRDPSARSGRSLPDSGSALLDTLAAQEYAPGIPASQLMAATYLKALWRTKGSGADYDDVDRAFRLAQRTELAAASAIARMAARALGGPHLAAKVRRLQDLEEKSPQLLQRAGALFAVGHDDVAERLKDIASEIAEIAKEIAEKFPRYYELIKPRALSIREVQKLLAAGEALILTVDAPALFSAPEETFIIVITHKDFRWARSVLGTPTLKREVAALRCGLDEEEWSTVTKSNDCGKLLGLADATDPSRPLPFHLGRAHVLYKALFGEVEGLIAGKRLLIVASGPLTGLPFSVLVTDRPRHQLPETFEQHFDVAWLGLRNALVTLPAVSSLASLREQLADHTPAPDQYIGYGNPVLVGDGQYCRPVKSPTDCPSVEAHRARVASADRRATIRGRGGRRSGGASIDQIYAPGAGSAAALDKVRALCPLPDTEYEITCVAAHFDKEARLLRLRANAKEQDIRGLSKSGRLGRYRILHFATHGLLAGDVQQIINRQGEPALVLTPPETPENVEDDGLLTASEVAALRLNADWVVLSACNTAAGEKIGAEALSGLARSFFYAGARSLLVSHWPVYSDAAVRLSTHAFAELDRDSSTGRAEALRRSMIALMNDRSQADNAHPAVWAPFVLVGEGRTQEK